jgi:hypothetical protein
MSKRQKESKRACRLPFMVKRFEDNALQSVKNFHSNGRILFE